MKIWVHLKLIAILLFSLNSLRASSQHLDLKNEEFIPSHATPKVKGYYKHRLKLTHDHKLSDVYLAYPYLNIKPTEKVQFVTQGAYSFMNSQSCEDVMIVGTLKPCISIVIFNDENKSTLGFHFHWSNRLEDIQNHISMLKYTNSRNLHAYIYSKEVESDESYKISFQFGYGGRTHSEQMDYVKNYIKNALTIPEQNIKKTLFVRYTKRQLGYLEEYLFADCCVAFKKNEGLPYNTCILHEDIFKLNEKKFRQIDMAVDSKQKKEVISLIGEDAYIPVLFKILDFKLRFNMVFATMTKIEKSRAIKALELDINENAPYEIYVETLSKNFIGDSKAPFYSTTVLVNILNQLTPEALVIGEKWPLQ